jgi:hypothetical protein
METKNNEDKNKDLQEELKAIKDNRLKGIENFRAIQKGLQPLLENEKRRLIKKYGTDHPRTRKIEAKLKHNINTVHHLDVEIQIAKIKVPKVDEKDLLINGRVTDEKLLGISNFMVYLTDSQKRKITSIKGTKTDTSGYYAFVINPKTAKTISKKKVYLTIYNEKGKILHQRDKPLEITEGGRESIYVSLAGAAITPPEKKEKKPAKKEKKKKEIKKTKEKIPPKAKKTKE